MFDESTCVQSTLKCMAVNIQPVKVFFSFLHCYGNVRISNDFMHTILIASSNTLNSILDLNIHFQKFCTFNTQNPSRHTHLNKLTNTKNVVRYLDNMWEGGWLMRSKTTIKENVFWICKTKLNRIRWIINVGYVIFWMEM